MPPGFNVTVLMNDRSSSCIEKGFLRCIARQDVAPFKTRRFVYCLHCYHLGSYSWFDTHKKEPTFDISRVSLAERIDRFEHYVGDITTEMELMNDCANLFKESPSADTVNETGTELPDSPLQPRPCPCELLDEMNESDSDDGGDPDDNQIDDERLSFKRLVECLTDCFDKFCFVHGTFDSSTFISLWQTLFRQHAHVDDTLDSEHFRLLKGKIISFAMKKIFVMLALTRKQMDTLNVFFKTILLFVSEDNTELCNHIHSGYMSCVRECEKRVDKRNEFVEESFQGCDWFSVALDTALFGKEHVLSCIGRFTFQDKMKQFPLFFDVCHASTGDEMATFVFERLKQMHAPFMKLSSITTDGANAMVGKRNGMVVSLKRLVRSDVGTNEPSINTIWCMSHRLNLVVRGFERVEHIKNVFKFSDWFSTKRNAVAYRRWLCRALPNNTFKKIPKPSETRWCFYREVISALLAQRKHIDAFLSRDEDFLSFRATLWQPDESTCTYSEGPFLNNRFIRSHFRFALFILDRICQVNSRLQEQYMTVPLAWCLVKQLRQDFSFDMDKISSGDYSNWRYLEKLNERQMTSFTVVLSELMLNMDIRFICPSLSIGTRLANRNIDETTGQLNPSFVRGVQRQCPLFELVGLFIFPDDLIKRREINPFFMSGKYPEVPLVAREIVEKEEAIRRVAVYLTVRRGEGPQTVIYTLHDVFQILEKDKYPGLWNLTRRVMSITPTSASCEQSFSCLKHRLHENMKKTTAFNFLLTSQNNSVFHL